MALYDRGGVRPYEDGFREGVQDAVRRFLNLYAVFEDKGGEAVYATKKGRSPFEGNEEKIKNGTTIHKP